MACLTSGELINILLFAINVIIISKSAEDLLVLKGGGKALERVSSVIIECGGNNLEFDNATDGARREGMK